MQLVIFDCDGTLVDSQAAITAAMEHAFRTVGLEPPSRPEILNVVGLSLPEAFAVVAGDHPIAVQHRLADLYRSDFPKARDLVGGRDIPFPGVREGIATLRARSDVTLGIATGKSRRGVARLLDAENWHGAFATIQTADDHPSKPHPSMIAKALAETGAAASGAVMIGDTSYDMEMARAAGVRAIGVAWGYHTRDRLERAGAEVIVSDVAGLLDVLGLGRG